MTAYIEEPLLPTIGEHRGNLWVDCVSAGEIHLFEVDRDFAEHLEGAPQMLVCRHCGLHLHADFEVGHPLGTAVEEVPY